MSINSQITNFYEQLVVDELQSRDEAQAKDDNELADIACVALNNLPARYYRFSVDMAFYLSSQEHQQMEQAVAEAVSHALEFVREHKRGSE